MTDPEPPAEILEVHWPFAQVLLLFEDLAAGAEVQHVQLRTRSSDSFSTLSQAQLAFVTGEAKAIQIRYSFDGEFWVDTIVAGDVTNKIIRHRLPMGTDCSYDRDRPIRETPE